MFNQVIGVIDDYDQKEEETKGLYRFVVRKNQTGNKIQFRLKFENS